MPRTKGAKNKRTLERERLERERLAAQGSLIPATGSTPVPAAAAPVADPGPTVESSSSAYAFREYGSPTGDRWRVERGAALLQDMEMSAESLRMFHEAIAPEERGWRLVRLHYGIAPLIGEQSADYLHPWGIEGIAELLGIGEEQVQAELDAVKGFWKKWQLARGGGRVEVAKPKMGVALGEQDQDQLLAFHGFSDLKDKGQKIYAAGRIQDFIGKLEDDEGKTIARRAIRLELQLQLCDRTISDLQQEMSCDRTPTSRKLADVRAELDRTMRMSQSLTAQHLEVMTKLDATQSQNPTIRKQKAFKDCLGQLIEAVREYDSRGDTTLIDGVFTAAEVQLLVTPLSLRPAQYRPDLVGAINDAMRDHNIFKQDYEPPGMTRTAFRRFRKAWRAALDAAASEDGDVVEMEDVEEQEEARTAAATSVAAAPADVGTASTGPVAPQPLPVHGAGDVGC